MNFTTLHHQIGLTLLSGIGSRRARTIIGHFSDLEAFFSEKRLNLAKIPGIPVDSISFRQRVEALVEADKIVEALEARKVQTSFFTDGNYPRRLKQCEDAPLLLYAQGNFNWNPERIIAVVGTRNATNYGKQITDELIDGLAQHDVTVVSGMAAGIDGFAHRAALKNKLPTWGVLGHGFDFMYPAEHRGMALKMMEQGGLISEFIPMQKPEPPHFPMRNRIVAGLADATLVIESGESGGSLITAQLALDYNRDVFAYPGDVHRNASKGCNKLIREDKARLITSSSDLIREMNWGVKTPAIAQRQLFVDLTEPEKRIVKILQKEQELSVDAIAYLAEVAVSSVSSQLLGLEFKGVVRCLPGRRFSLI